jgi:hypothetical protein
MQFFPTRASKTFSYDNGRCYVTNILHAAVCLHASGSATAALSLRVHCEMTWQVPVRCHELFSSPECRTLPLAVRTRGSLLSVSSALAVPYVQRFQVAQPWHWTLTLCRNQLQAKAVYCLTFPLQMTLRNKETWYTILVLARDHICTQAKWRSLDQAMHFALLGRNTVTDT